MVRSPVVLRYPSRAIFLPFSVPYAGVWAMRKLVPTYTGPLFKLYNQTTTATLDVYARPDGKPYMGDYPAFAGSAIITVQTVYEQTGTGNHAEQLTPGSQPLFRTANATFDKNVYPITFGYSTAGALGKRFLTIPTTLSLDRAAVTALYCGIQGGPFNLNTMFSLGSGSAACLSLYSQASKSAPNNFTVGAWGSTERSTSVRPLGGQPSVMSVRSNGTNTIVNLDGRQISMGSQTSTTMTGALIGADNLNSGYFGVNDFFGLVAVASSISDADYALVKDALDRNFNCQTRFTKQIIFDGDSITCGNNGKAYNRGLIRQICEALHGQGVATWNNGLSGQRMASGTAMYPNRSNTLNLFNSTLYSKQVLVAHGGHNDIAIDSASGATVWGAKSPSQSGLRGYIEAAQTTGFVNPIIGNVFPGTDITAGAKETARTDYNTFIASNTADGYTIVDYASIPELSNPLSTTYFSDGIHPTEMGDTVRAALLLPLIQAQLA